MSNKLKEIDVKRSHIPLFQQHDQHQKKLVLYKIKIDEKS